MMPAAVHMSTLLRMRNSLDSEGPGPSLPTTFIKNLSCICASTRASAGADPAKVRSSPWTTRRTCSPS